MEHFMIGLVIFIMLGLATYRYFKGDGLAHAVYNDVDTATTDVLKRLTDGLILISDTDSYWTIFSPVARIQGRPMDCPKMVGMIRLKGCDDHWSFDDYLKHLINSQINQRDRYWSLYDGLVEMLGDRQVFKFNVSPNRYRYYITGYDYQGNLVGIYADAVET